MKQTRGDDGRRKGTSRLVVKDGKIVAEKEVGGLQEIARKAAEQEWMNKFGYRMPSNGRVMCEKIAEDWCIKTALRALQSAIQPLEEENEKLRDKLQLIIPMAKGWAHLHPVGNNWTFIEEAEAILQARIKELEAKP